MKSYREINLQLFAEGESTEESANLNNDTGEANTNVDDNGDQQPDIDVKPEEQSINKDNPANHAFAEMRRKIKELETTNKTLIQQKKEKDEYYANLAKQAGRTDITTEEQYHKAAKLEKLAADYKETGDPLLLVELIKESGAIPQQPKQETIDIDSILNKEVDEFNKEFKHNLNSFEEIPTLPNSDKIIGYMQDKDLSLKEAYMLANPDKVRAAEKQAAINQAKGLTHVVANSNSGKVEKITVTAAEVAEWKRWFPGKTDEQCRKEIADKKNLFED